MTSSRARSWLEAIFIAGFVVQVAATILVYLERAISSIDLTNLVVQSLETYSVPMAVILGGIFATKRASSGSTESSILAFWTAAVVAIIWNSLLVWPYVQFGYEAFDLTAVDTAQNVSLYVDQIAKPSSFLVAGALTYFFAGKP
jgi:hypothetical protein